MNTVILDGFNCENPFSKYLTKQLAAKGEVFSVFRLKDMNILPCTSCGSCGCQTPGQCVIKDDMSQILRAMASSKVMILLTKVRFGGYSSLLKKAMDRTMPIGLPFYIKEDGHLLHSMRYGRKHIIAIGMLPQQNHPGHEQNFRRLVAANALNMQSSCSALLLKPTDDLAVTEKELDFLLDEVKKI
ncbi:flavodoxin family protein [Dehalobacterium formicoaceticum]|uniref:NAD(P)H-dependent oxidoreductase n=1 Tax=Dehalobacterium formicoaceticum TaxID=51515 RepID=A0ABT1Y0V3_9FIRM|nr:NAD(P)H-dependent oxidoreductase [Dehalobacterium formicoaceticum]MCR6544156.1 NAD(P)H-dependent oxidoreductase [Dehalobacterium formicoaceticum]